MKLKILRIMAIITGLIGTTLFNRFMEGGWGIIYVTYS